LTRARSDFKERRDAGFFAFIGFPHAEDVAIRATPRVAHDSHPAFQAANVSQSSPFYWFGWRMPERQTELLRSSPR